MRSNRAAGVPGQYEGAELTCDSQRNITNLHGQYPWTLRNWPKRFSKSRTVGEVPRDAETTIRTCPGAIRGRVGNAISPDSESRSALMCPPDRLESSEEAAQWALSAQTW